MATASATAAQATDLTKGTSKFLGEGTSDEDGAQLAMATNNDDTSQQASSMVPPRYEPAAVPNRYAVSPAAKRTNPATRRIQRNSLRHPRIGSSPPARASRTR